jgi:hypothetical protein
MHAVVLLCPYSDSQSSELLSSDTSNPQHKTAHPHHHCLSTPSLPMTARKMIHSIPGPYSKSIIPPRITASAANACGSLLTPKSKAPRRSTVASLGIVREALPILASGKQEVIPKSLKSFVLGKVAGVEPTKVSDLPILRFSSATVPKLRLMRLMSGWPTTRKHRDRNCRVNQSRAASRIVGSPSSRSIGCEVALVNLP